MQNHNNGCDKNLDQINSNLLFIHQIKSHFKKPYFFYPKTAFSAL